GFRDEMIRDRLVVGIQDQLLSECMQLDATLDLEKAKKMVCQHAGGCKRSISGPH
uniref:Uncharacterized protein n=1 Tax=Amphimedon queenslandica TaxID=400682 RepID=A0A1X7VRM7_AMPQE